ncbi:unnamed protein product [Microthlaspi erraticum]|uniref:Uncharacterized protein n=1 Tax=Microthlaspi erraticum TaxID=1685480 RepID=A0A6D2JF61_9BRAS|nr:unnamed protein product [Microthlaspi erraticum]
MKPLALTFTASPSPITTASLSPSHLSLTVGSLSARILGIWKIGFWKPRRTSVVPSIKQRDWRLNEDGSKFAGSNVASTVRIGTKVAAAQRLNFQASMRVSISCWWIFVYFSNFCGAEKVADALKQNRSIATIDMVRITIFFSIFPKWFGDAEKLTKALFSFASKTVHWLLFKVDKGKRKALNAKEFTGVMQDIEVGVNIEKLKPALATRW